jgi:hypothetical protein
MKTVCSSIPILMLVTFLFYAPMQAQQYLGLEKELVIEQIKKSANTPPYTVSLSDTLIRTDSTDHLGVVYDGPEKIEMDYYFTDLGNDCDSIVIKYYCGDCVEKHIQNLLSYKENTNWIVLQPDHYISTKGKIKLVTKPKEGKTVKKVGSPQMKITRTPGNKVAATVVFYIPLMSEEEWEKLVKK